MTRIQNDKMLNNVINSVTAAGDQEKNCRWQVQQAKVRNSYETVTKRQDIKEESSHEYHCGSR